MCIIFFNVGPPKESMFLTNFYGLYFSHHYTCYKSQFFHDIDHLWAASMYCIYTCLSDLWVLIFICCTSVFVWSWISYIPLLLISSLFHPCWRAIILVVSLHLSFLICCVWTVAIRASGVDHLIGLLFRTRSCCWMPPWFLYLPLPLVLVAVHLEDLLFTFWRYLTLTNAQWLYYTPLVPLIALPPYHVAVE